LSRIENSAAIVEREGDRRNRLSIDALEAKEVASAAERLIAKMRREFDTIRQKARRTKRRVRVYAEAWPNPRISSPPWVAEIVQIAGGQMVVPAGEKLTDEQVAAARPDAIILAWAATGSKADAKKSVELAEWRDVPAIRNRRVHVISDELLNTPGPPLMQGARQLFHLLHHPAPTKART